MNEQFLGEELTPAENNRDTARYQVVPCGLEATVSYGGGTGNGAAAMIAASHQLERWLDDCEPCAAGIFTHAAIDCTQPIEKVMADLRTATAEITKENKIPITLGGEHSITYGAVMGVLDSLKEKEAEPLGIIHIDAHADFRDAYQGQKHSHASVMYLLAQTTNIPMASFGVRALSKEEEAARRAHGVVAYDAAELVRGNISAVELPQNFPQNVYISFDVDGLDPAVLPATGTPVPGGLGFYQSLDLIASATKGRRVVGADIVELAPVSGQPASDFTAALIAYNLMKFAAN